MTNSLSDLLVALSRSWGTDTAQDAIKSRGPASGQCAVSSLIIHDCFGGSILRGSVATDEGFVVHYWNELPGGFWLDSTRDQFEEWEIAVNVRPALIEDYWFSDTERKYSILRARVIKYLEENNACYTRAGTI